MWIIQKESKYMAVPLTEVSCAVIMDGDRVLVTQRSEHMPHPLKWEFPGGKLQPGETPEGCIIREIREELGVEISVLQLLPSVRHRYPDLNIKLIPFVCSITKGEIDLSEHRSFSWISRSELDQIDWLEADIGVVALIDKYC
jgi:8-oxo-dGTP diphosphatase